jgi:hypothetical protein
MRSVVPASRMQFGQRLRSHTAVQGGRPLLQMDRRREIPGRRYNERTFGYSKRSRRLLMYLFRPANSLIPLALPFCHGRGRGFEPVASDWAE